MKKNYFKKSLSLIMTMLMLMSCWVFAPAMAGDDTTTADATTYAEGETGHNLSDWEITVAATCIKAGSRQRACTGCAVTDCNYTETEEIPATGVHEYGEWAKYDYLSHQGKCTSDADCTETIVEAHILSDEIKIFDETKHYYKCAKCDLYGFMFGGEFREDLKEECYGDGVTYVINGDGTHTAICICGNTKTKIHEWWDIIESKAATCEEDGFSIEKCFYCDATTKTTLTATGHNWDEGTVITEATCTVDGEKTYTCQNDASHTYTETVTASGHDFSVFVETVANTCDAGGYDIYRCSNCDETTQMNITEAAHKPAADYTVVEKATCEADGYKAILCTECGAEIETETIAKREHNLVDTTVAQAATCAVTGIMNQKCDCAETDTHKACEYTTTRTIPVDPDAHDWNDWAQTADPTCSAAGEETRTCKNSADHKETREVATDSTAHDWSDWTVTTAPTCSAAGEETRTCKNNADHKETREVAIDETAHDWNDWTVTTAPTCLAAGEETRTCKNDPDHKETREAAIDATAHKAQAEYIQTLAPTCATKGEETLYCEYCKAVMDTREIDLNKDNHENFEQIKAQAATCLAVGWYSYEKCDKCGYTTYEEIPVTPLNHASTETVTKNFKAGTCTEDGYTGDVYYSCCDTLKEMGQVIPVGSSHTLKEMKYTAATCTRDGYSYSICDVCGVEYDERVHQAMGHNYENTADYTVIVAPACTEGGAKYLKCTRCGELDKVQDFAPKGHYYFIYQETVQPTCTTPGKEESKRCIDCQYEIIGAVIPATGHDENGNGKCENCDSLIYGNGSKACTCLCHKDSFIIKIVYKIVNFFWKLFGTRQTCDCGVVVHY